MASQRFMAHGLLLAGVLMTASVAHAEFSTDVRAKLGNAAGIDTIEFKNNNNWSTFNASQDGGGNFQVEVILGDRQDAGANFVGGLGVFGRTHKGNANAPFFPQTAVDYRAFGVSGAGGVGIAANRSLQFEGRVELDFGLGKPTLSTPNPIWKDENFGAYGALDLIAGGYGTFGRSGLQLGLELGVQYFAGRFKIGNNFGNWFDAKVKGRGGIANVVIGYRF